MQAVVLRQNKNNATSLAAGEQDNAKNEPVATASQTSCFTVAVARITAKHAAVVA